LSLTFADGTKEVALSLREGQRLEKRGAHLFEPHVPHLVGHTGETKDSATGVRSDAEPWGCTEGIDEDSGLLGEERLFLIACGHYTLSFHITFSYLLERVGIYGKLEPQRAPYSFCSEIVRSGTESASADDNVGSFNSMCEGLRDGVEPVAGCDGSYDSETESG
jgi:hypothetical protein